MTTTTASGSATYIGRNVRWTGPALTAAGEVHTPTSHRPAVLHRGQLGVVAELVTADGTYRVSFDGGYDLVTPLPGEYIALVPTPRYAPEWVAAVFLWLPELIVIAVSFAAAGAFGLWQLALPGIAAALWIVGNRALIRRQNDRTVRARALLASGSGTDGDVVDSEVVDGEVAR